MIGDLTGVTLDGSDRLKQKRAQIQPTLWLPMLRPQIQAWPHPARCGGDPDSRSVMVTGRTSNSHLLGLVRARSAQLIGES